MGNSRWCVGLDRIPANLAPEDTRAYSDNQHRRRGMSNKAIFRAEGIAVQPLSKPDSPSECEDPSCSLTDISAY